MRLWSLHPRYLSNKVLKMTWLDALRVQKSIRTNKRHFKHAKRFYKEFKPLEAIGYYLMCLAFEAKIRNLNFNPFLVHKTDPDINMRVSDEQIMYETWLLEYTQAPLKGRVTINDNCFPHRVHPIFFIDDIKGVEPWEKIHPDYLA